MIMMIYGELGKFPLILEKQVRMAKWRVTVEKSVQSELSPLVQKIHKKGCAPLLLFIVSCAAAY